MDQTAAHAETKFHLNAWLLTSMLCCALMWMPPKSCTSFFRVRIVYFPLWPKLMSTAKLITFDLANSLIWVNS